LSELEKRVDALLRLVIAEDSESANEAKKEIKKLLGQGITSNYYSTETPETITREIMLELGCPDHLLGHPYLLAAILMVIDDKMYINNITFGLYPQLAVDFDTTPQRVERAIRHIVEVTWTRGDLDVLNKYFGNTVNPEKGKPTNGEFIARIANVVKQRL